MADHNASSLPRPDAPTRPVARSSIPRSSSSYGSYGSYETGESSTSTSLPRHAPIESTTLGRSSSRNHQEPSSDPRFVEHGDQSPSYDARLKRRSHKPRPSGGFLLSNNILDQDPAPGPKSRSGGPRRSLIPVDSRKGKSPLRLSEDSNPSVSGDLRAAPDGSERKRALPARLSTGGADSHEDRPRSQMANRPRSMLPSLRPNSAPLDVDSAQIVSMALDLSDSRRLASRRIISNPIPPRLTQLPDSTPGRSLKQHLQQQRRSSRNISPRADRNSPARIVSSPRISSPLYPPADHDGSYSYTYHFSSSTLNRAQRAKEYMELMAQYRRLLVFLPPLKQGTHSRPSTSSAITSPTSTNSSLQQLSSSQSRALGRAYNPLQYIRNRKIRTRERKTIDGEAQGFGDVLKVTQWVDDVSTLTATSPTSESQILPPFPVADESMGQHLPASNIPRPTSALNKPKRPRFEWSIDPADMLADIYWLEQDGNKFLIEDRHYTKIYTARTETSQSTTQTIEPPKLTLVTPAIKEQSEGDAHDMPEHDIVTPIKADTEPVTIAKRDRARQKLQDLKEIRHKHSNSLYSHHEFLKFRRGSSSDSSDNESDRRRRVRKGTISASGKDLLEKQMKELLAKESQDEQENPIDDADVGHLKPLPTGMITPERNPQIPGPGHTRKSRIEPVEHTDKPILDRSIQTPPATSGRASLEVPTHHYRSSIDLDSSRPPFIDTTQKTPQNGYIPAIGMDLSPNVSRPSSPARNPFSKVKSIFRDRSRDREDRDNDGGISSPIDSVGATSLSPVTESATSLVQRPRSKSATREFTPRASLDNPRSHRTMASLSLRPDEQVVLKTIFKGGAKIDDMIRGGVSKVTDLIWKKDSDASGSSDDDSDAGVHRGRSTRSAFLSPGSSPQYYETRRPVKNYKDIMPNFKSAIDSIDKPISHETDGSSVQAVSRPPSRSSRFDQLKPPRIDIYKASPDLSELDESNPQNLPESDMSEIDSYSRDLKHTTSRSRQSSKELQNALSIHDTESPVSLPEYGARVFGHRSWGIPDRTALSQNLPISRREVARLRTHIIRSGIKASEISRRANEPHLLSAPDSKTAGQAWTGISRFMSDEESKLCVTQTELFPTTARILSHSIDRSIKLFEESASRFSVETAPGLQQRIDVIQNRVAFDFMDMTRRAADDADEVSHDIVDHQRLKAKSVVDAMDKMLRRRRRRFRWARRAGWLAVEWVLVGFMWYVWFIVMIAQVVLGAGRGVVTVVRWLLWL
ncbi:hypothetical protein F5Y14DRAFT_409791 [Nemania sp. NC0429]|nr:hypothetical protein F5Y14DRAFT_409791 [Nemania sp. NC0429]